MIQNTACLGQLQYFSNSPRAVVGTVLTLCHKYTVTKSFTTRHTQSYPTTYHSYSIAFGFYFLHTLVSICNFKSLVSMIIRTNLIQIKLDYLILMQHIGMRTYSLADRSEMFQGYVAWLSNNPPSLNASQPKNRIRIQHQITMKLVQLQGLPHALTNLLFG